MKKAVNLRVSAVTNVGCCFSGLAVEDIILIRTAERSRWWRGTTVERRSLASELSMLYTQPSADG